ncbi:MAG: metallophosphoesterase [Bacteroidales bacterium]|nr:metallophosphoesterase [Bacteroidales bacterium]
MGDGIFLVRRLIPGGRAFSATWAVYSGSRRKMIRNSGMAAAAVLFSGLTWGMISGAYRFRLSRIDLRYGHLPGSFEGFKIVQISDLHLGSWAFPGKLEEVVRLIMKEMPDLIVFTGDLVNDRTREAEGFGTILSGLRAPFGVYAILGNHDYGDYARWASSEEKAKNMQELQDFYNQVGWKLLRNEYTILEKDGGQMALIGSENWGALSRFPKYGDLSLATERMEQVPFSILLTHDPTHWDLHVIRHTRVIDLTLSGHTHGFQFGIEYEGLSWSPARLLYKHWGGLYHENHTASNRSIDLYVNRGLGHLGYPGRVGILPEITVFQLFT